MTIKEEFCIYDWVDLEIIILEYNWREITAHH